MRIKIFLLLMSGIMLAASIAVQASEDMQNVKKYLFIDDQWIEHSYQIVRAVIPPEKHPLNPLVVADKPWEGRNVYLYGTVIYENGRFRMWYQVYNLDTKDPLFRTSVGYAESADGLHWQKPLLGLIKYQGKPTNLVLLNHGTSDLASLAVVKTSDDPDPAHRYKMLYWDSMSQKDLEDYGTNFPPGESVPGWRAIPGEGFFIAYSRDGIHWSNGGPQPVFTCPCDATSMSRGADGIYHAYYKISVAGDRHFRVLGASRSKDFVNWTEPRVILEPDWHDSYGTEFYGMSAFNYAGNTIGLIWVYYNAPSDKHVDLQLATCTDEGVWQRAGDRKVFLRVGQDGDWDGGMIFTAASDLLVSPPGHEDRIWLYYGGSTVRHDDKRFRETSIGLASFRLDGFAAMEAKQFRGYFTTTTLTVTSDKFYINANSKHGFIRIEASDVKTGKVITTGTVIKGVDATKIAVHWKDGRLPLHGKVSLRFTMQKAKLYAFWFGK